MSTSEPRKKPPYWFRFYVGTTAVLTRGGEQMRLTVVRTVPAKDATGGVDVDIDGVRTWLPRNQQVSSRFGDTRVTISAGHIRPGYFNLAVTAPDGVDIDRPRNGGKGHAA